MMGTIWSKGYIDKNVDIEDGLRTNEFLVLPKFGKCSWTVFGVLGFSWIFGTCSFPYMYYPCWHHRLWGMARDYVWQALWDQLVSVLGSHPFTYLYLGTTLVRNIIHQNPQKMLFMAGVNHCLLGSRLSFPLLWHHTEARGIKATLTI